MKKFKVFLLALLTFLLIIIFTSPFLELFAKITKQSIYGGSWGFSGKAYEEGFFISYSFFVTLAVMIFGGRKKYWILTVLLGVAFLILIIAPELLIISVGAAVAAWLIAQAVLVLKKKVSKK
jgi:hypothetical protein